LWLQFLEWPELFLFFIPWHVLLKESLYTAFRKKLNDRWLEQYVDIHTLTEVLPSLLCLFFVWFALPFVSDEW
jgi:hypothetical protein